MASGRSPDRKSDLSRGQGADRSYRPRHARNSRPTDPMCARTPVVTPPRRSERSMPDRRDIDPRSFVPQAGRPPGGVRNLPTVSAAPEEAYRQRQFAGVNALLAAPTVSGPLVIPRFTPVTQQSSFSTSAPVLRTPETRPHSMLTPRQMQSKRAEKLAVLSEPAVRGAMALMLSYIVSGALSFAFWAVAAHQEKAATVGSVSAEVSAISFLASVGSLNLINVFARFLPEAGRHARRMIIVSYGGAVVAALLSTGIFLFTPLSSGLVLGGEAGRLGFTLCVILNSVFMIQDGGLIGFGRSGWVPIENIGVAAARLGLMPLAVTFLSAKIGVLWSWGLPMAIAVVVINALNIGLLAGRQSTKHAQLPMLGELSRFVAIESVTTAVSSAVGAFLPALVTRQLGATQGGYFYVPWVIATMASGLLSSVMLSMIREVVVRPEGSAATIRRSLGLASLVVVGGLLICVFAGQMALSPLGPAFVAHGAQLLRWIGLALPAAALNLLFWATCLVRRRPWPVLALNLTTSIGIIGGSLSLRHGADSADIGVIYCAVQWAVAIVVFIPTVKGLHVVHERSEEHETLGTSTPGSAINGRWPDALPRRETW